MKSERKAMRSDGQHSREVILRTATALATTDGLDGLSIGRLAEHAGMSKSGLYAHFGSKEELQLATINEAERVFDREVLEPARKHPVGLPRLMALAEAYLSYLQRRVFPGGCFFAAVAGEFGARQGPVADRIRALNLAALTDLMEQLRAARAAGDLTSDADDEQLAFEIDALMLGAHSAFLLFSDPADLDRARRAIWTRLSQG